MNLRIYFIVILPTKFTQNKKLIYTFIGVTSQ